VRRTVGIATVHGGEDVNELRSVTVYSLLGNEPDVFQGDPLHGFDFQVSRKGRLTVRRDRRPHAVYIEGSWHHVAQAAVPRATDQRDLGELELAR
jgi:hypothetical protein